jgi:hypothetical protein
MRRGFGGGVNEDAINELIAAARPNAVWIPAGAFIPRVTNGPSSNSSETATHDKNYETLDFDSGADEFADVWLLAGSDIPASLSEGPIGTVHYLADSGHGVSETVVWNLQLAIYPNSTAIDKAHDATANASGVAVTASGTVFRAISAALTFSAPVLEGDLACLTISRDVSADNLAADARLLGVYLEWLP